MKPHYDRIRRVKTASGSTAIQVGYYQGKRFKLIKHIGSSKYLQKIKELEDVAREYILSRSPQIPLNFNPHSEEIMYKRGIRVERSYLGEAYDYLSDIYSKIGFSKLDNEYLKHFSIIRVLEPSSKIKSIELLSKYFDIRYKKTSVFRELFKIRDLKDKVVEAAIKYAKHNLGFDFTLVFYDVTTLYFEADEGDEFRLSGFSKDNKIREPQILVGLLVEKIGFPIFFDLFPGNTFEGHTIIPVILKIKKKYRIKRFTVVADAGMLSQDNLTELEKNKIDYVVGSRVKTLKPEEVKKMLLLLNRENGKVIKLGNVIYQYLLARAKKDKRDNDKQIEKAKYYLSNPAKIFKRSKFLSHSSKNKFQLNKALVEKYRLLEGIKGYRTNIDDLSPELLIKRYKDLWRIEQSFRIAKSDLEARPIYHRKKNSIEYHFLIVFVALCMTKVIEIKEGKSIKKVVEDLKNRWTIILKDEISGNRLKLKLNKKPH